MSDKPTFDIVMMFVTKKGESVWAESTLGVLKTDQFMKGFEPIAAYDEYSNFFEVQSFNFSIKVKDDDESVSTMSQAAQGGAGHGAGASGGRAPAAKGEFSSWRSANNDQFRKLKFPIEFDSFTFTRVIDGASPAFFSACANQESFKSAVLVRRVASGTSGGEERQSFGFLRLEFKDIMLTEVNWSDGDMVSEEVSFICKAMRLRYKQQRPEGDLFPEVEATWDQERDGTSGAPSGRST